MPSDDDYYRRRDFNDYLIRSHDRADIERLQHQQRSAIAEGIRDQDDFKVYLALGITPPRVSSHDAVSTTASAAFRRHTRSLLFELEWNDVLPASVLAQWQSHVNALDIEQPRASLRLLAVLSANYDEAKSRFKPEMLSVSRSMDFENQVPRIGREINSLIQILERVIATAPRVFR